MVEVKFFSTAHLHHHFPGLVTALCICSGVICILVCVVIFVIYQKKRKKAHRGEEHESSRSCVSGPMVS